MPQSRWKPAQNAHFPGAHAPRNCVQCFQSYRRSGRTYATPLIQKDAGSFSCEDYERNHESSFTSSIEGNGSLCARVYTSGKPVWIQRN